MKGHQLAVEAAARAPRADSPGTVQDARESTPWGHPRPRYGGHAIARDGRLLNRRLCVAVCGTDRDDCQSRID